MRMSDALDSLKCGLLKWPWRGQECLHERTRTQTYPPTMWMPWESVCVECVDCEKLLSTRAVPYVPPRMQYVDRYKALRAAYRESRR